MPMSPRLLRPRASGPGAIVATDTDARNYIASVHAADGQPLEQAVQLAINAFVVGCKADGIWSAIKASCILMGARTLSGALTPLVGSAPTNNGPFVSGDYNRKTGLVGNGSTKYLDSNRNNNADPQNSKHIAVYVSSLSTGPQNTFIGALPNTGAGRSDIEYLPSGNSLSIYANSVNTAVARTGAVAGFFGASRSGASAINTRVAGSTQSGTVSSQTPFSGNLFVFARNLQGTANQIGNGRTSFYSIGESLSLDLLDSQVTTLYNAIGAAIP